MHKIGNISTAAFCALFVYLMLRSNFKAILRLDQTVLDVIIKNGQNFHALFF